MAGILPARHAQNRQEGQLDTQDEPITGGSAERQDAFNENAHSGSPDQVG